MEERASRKMGNRFCGNCHSREDGPAISDRFFHQLLPQAFQIALHFQRSVYDALYVALAVSRKLIFITADERLVNALGTFFPVKWLGAA